MNTQADEALNQAAPIAAIATASGAAGVCVVRISGNGALALGDRLMPRSTRGPSTRATGTFFHSVIVHPQTGERLDDALVLIFRAPNSFTGEETLEIQGHGGVLPPQRLLEAVLAAGARLAEPGEFTRRAFLNNRLDLTQAEALCDFIASKSARAAQVARAQLEGALGHRIGVLTDQVTQICADVAYLLDFDEGELPDDIVSHYAARASDLVDPLNGLIDSWQSGHLLRDGAMVVISGRPNAGKSSLLNALLGRNRAIVHASPGTTRDIIEEQAVLNGVPLRLVDTAGLRETEDAVEREGISRARAWMTQADFNLHLIDSSVHVSAAVAAEIERLSPARTVLVLTKCDLPLLADLTELTIQMPVCKISAQTGMGLSELHEKLSHLLGLEYEAQDQTVVSLRQVTELREAVDQIKSAITVLSSGPEYLVIAATHLRQAAEALGRVTGRVYSDDLLDSIFSRFCVGK